MDIQVIMDMVSRQRKEQSSNLRIGEMLTNLKQFSPTAKIMIDNNFLNHLPEDDDYAGEYKGKQLYFANHWFSYRGYYEDLALQVTTEQKEFTVQNLIDLLNNAKDKGKMYGYKGGEFSITDDTIVWLEAEYNNCRGYAPISFYKISDNVILLIMKHIE